MAEQIPYSDIGINPDNPEPRCPCVLLLDTSSSMGEVVGEPGRDLGYTFQQDGQTYRAVSGGVTRLNLLSQGLQAYHDNLMTDSLAPQRVEISVITFGGTVRTATPFTTALHFIPPTLTAEGETPMGAAILLAIEAVTERKRLYKQNGLHYYRPWIFLITDGEPTDDWAAASALVKAGEERKEFAFFSVGVTGANFSILERISTRKPLRLEGTKFRELFQWLSQSQRSVSQSTPGLEDRIQLSSPSGWASL